MALAVGIVRIPPTYFVLQHAERMPHEAALFTLVAEVTDTTLRTPVRAAVPQGRLSFRQREYVEPLFLGRMARMIARHEPDLIHQHAGTWAVPAVRASRRSGAPLVTTLHGADVFTQLRPATTAMQRWHRLNFHGMTRQSTRVLAVSHYLADRAVEAGVPADRLTVHYQGVDTDIFTPGHDRTTREVPVVTHVGALHERKGVHDLVAASCLLVHDLPHELRLVGSGPMEEDLHATSRSHPHIRVLGALDRGEVREEMRDSDVFVLATQEYQGAREAAGLVTLEAQACGVPVVVNDSGGAREMVLPGETGLLAREKDVESLAAALRTLLSMPADERADMGSRAREFVVARRSTAQAVVELDEVYRSL